MKLLVVAAATVVASSAMAQSAFEGFYGQIATGFENNNISSSQTSFTTVPATTPSTYSNPSSSFGNAPIVATLGYTFSLTKKYTLGIGADYSFITSKSGNITSTPSDPADDTSVGYAKVSNRMNIFLTPGYVIDKNSLAYLKVGYSGQKIEQFDASDNASGGSSNANGYILGLGYKQIISGGFYGFGEANYMS